MRKSWSRAIQPSVCALKLKQACVVLCMQQNNNQKTQWCSFRASKVSSACLIKPKNRHKLNHTKIRQSPPLISDSAFIELLPCQLICAFSLHITAILLLQSTIVAVRCAYFSLTEKCIVVCVSEGVSVSCLQWKQESWEVSTLFLWISCSSVTVNWWENNMPGKVLMVCFHCSGRALASKRASVI